MYHLRITSAAEKELKKVSKANQKKFFHVVGFLGEAPFSGKKLSGELKGYYSIRLWPYRILYTLDKQRKIVTIRAIKHRQEAYK